jgi:hypothetical protein
MIVMVAVVVAEVVIIVVVIIVIVGTNNGIGVFAKFKVSVNIGKIRVMLNREHNGR